jgi:hypothetical protein
MLYYKMFGVKELSVEHILMFVIVAFLLYHLVGRCGCANGVVDGFSVGGGVRRGSGNCLKHYDNESECGKENGCVWIEEGNYRSFSETNGDRAKCLSLGNLIDIRENDYQNCSSAFYSNGKDIGNIHHIINITGDDGKCIPRPVCLPNKINNIGWSDTTAPTCGPASCGPDPDKYPHGSRDNDWEQLGNITQSDIVGYGCEFDSGNIKYHGCWPGDRALCIR